MMKYETKPWSYITIDNFFHRQHLEQFTKSVSLLETFEKQHDDVWFDKPNRSGVVGAGIIPSTKRIASEYLDVLKTALFTLNPQATWSSFDYSLSWCGRDFNYKWHTDDPSKILSCIVYLDPKSSIGTILSDQPNGEEHEVDWKVNRALLFHPTENVTWHKFKTIKPRWTVNMWLKD